MAISEKTLERITQILLLAVIVVVPFVKIDSLYFPFVSGKAYMFRALVAVAFFFWVWLMLKEREYRPNMKNILVAAVALFFFAQLFVSFFGANLSYSLFSSIERADGVIQYGFWAAYFLMLVSVFRKEWHWKVLFSAFVGVAVVLSAYSWLNSDTQIQLYGLFGNPAYFGAFLLFAIGFALILSLKKLFYPHPAYYLFPAAAAFCTITLIFTQIRGVYIGFAGGAFLFCVLAALFLRKENKLLAYGSIGLLLLGFLAAGLLFAAKDTSFVRETPMLSRVAEITEFWEVGSIRERLLNWNIALKAFAEKPAFGYGPENFDVAANKYYDYDIGKNEPWFDRAHNQPLDTLATGGIVLFSFYVFLLGAAAFLIFRVAKKQKMLGFLLAGTFFAYFLQGSFLFDTLPTYLGLFPFLAFLVWVSMGKGRIVGAADRKTQSPGAAAKRLPVLGLAGALVLFVLYTAVFTPWQANAAALQFYIHAQTAQYQESISDLKKSFSVKSPYTYWEIRKRAGWQLVGILDRELEPQERAGLTALYDFLVPELEKFVEYRPADPQIHFMLAKIYRLGSEKLGKNDLVKAEQALEKGFEYSTLRIEYYNEYVQVLLLQGRFEEAEQSIREYVARADFGEEFSRIMLGNFYFVAERPERALEQYELAMDIGYQVHENEMEYIRYITAAEQVEDYQRIIDMAKKRLAHIGPHADTYFNIAVGYFNMGQPERGREFLLEAIDLDPEYGQYRQFFGQ